MKKLFFMLIGIIFLVAINGCSKDELQPNGWQRFWHKETIVMADLNDKHMNLILPKIDAIRTTLNQYVMWDADTIQVYGPGGYTPTAKKSWKVWQGTYERILMGDTINPSTKGVLPSIIKQYLDLRRDNERNDAFDKMWLCIPKELYEQDERFWEWWLETVSNYLTVNLGGPDAWTDGTRSMQEEMKIYHLPTTPDPEDPWHCECSAEIRITDWYLKYAEGPDKKVLLPNDFASTMNNVRNKHAQSRYEMYKNIETPGFEIGTVEDYTTKPVVIEGKTYYVLAFPAIQMVK